MNELPSLPLVAPRPRPTLRVLDTFTSSVRNMTRQWVWWAIVLATVCFRLPELENAAGVNSDASIVGLQALHILHGQWSPWLQGSSYQTSTDALVAAVYFALFGSSPLVLMVSTLSGHVLLIWIVYAMLTRIVGSARAAILCSLLVFTTCVVEVYAVHPPRQTALTLVFLSAWIHSADHRIASSYLRIALGGFVAAISVFADPYAVVFVGPLMMVAATSVFATEASLRDRAKLGGVYLGALLVGSLPLLLLWSHHGGPPAEVGVSIAGMSARLKLLRTICLPIVLGFRIPAPLGPIAVGSFGVHVAGAVALLIGFVSGGAAFLLRVPKSARRLAILGLATCGTTVLGFLLSPCAVDQHSHRYLVGVSLMLPFVLAPLAYLLDWKRLALVVFPIALSFATAGWAGYGSRVSGLHIHSQSAQLEADEERVEAFLSERGVTYAIANYWEAYTMTFLYRESVVVVPREPWLDRIPADRARMLSSHRIGYIVNRTVPWDKTAMTEFWLKPLGTVEDRVDLGRYTVLILKR